MKIINKGIPRNLKFGENGDLDLITISTKNQECDENFELARSIFISNGEIIESECLKKKRFLVLSTKTATNIPMVVSSPGEYLFHLESFFTVF